MITGSGCNSSERFEKEYVGKCGDLSTFHYSREAYGPRIDLFSLLPLPPLLALTSFPPFSLRYVTREKEALCHIPKLSKSEVTPLKISLNILNSRMAHLSNLSFIIHHNETKKQNNNIFNNVCVQLMYEYLFHFSCFCFHKFPYIIGKKKLFSLFTRQKSIVIFSL